MPAALQVGNVCVWRLATGWRTDEAVALTVCHLPLCAAFKKELMADAKLAQPAEIEAMSVGLLTSI